MSAPALRPYQSAGLEAIASALAAGQNRVLLKAPTGTGKTVTFAEMLKYPALRNWLNMLPSTQRRMLVIAHREELLDQAAEKIQAANPGIMVSIEQGPRHANRFSHVVIASIQTLQASKFRRLKELLRHGGFGLVVVDEAHHAAAPTYRTALVHLGFLPPADASDSENMEAANDIDVAEMEKNLAHWDERAPKDRLLVGVTATPNRSDAIGLGCVFQTIAYSYALKDAIDDGWLVPIVPWVVETKDNLDEVRTVAGEFNQKDLANTVNNLKRNQLAVEAWQQYAPARQTLAFTVDVQHAHDLASAFVNAGVKAKALSGETPKDERRQMLEDFRQGTVQVITNCMVLTEGTDLPTASCILHAKPTKSATLYEQMTGRGLRVDPRDAAGPERLNMQASAPKASSLFTKPDCIVIDIVDIARRHSLQTSPVLYGLPPGLKPQGKDLKKLETLFDEFLGKHPGFDMEKAGRVTMEQLEVRASTFDIWSIPQLGEVGEGLTGNWVKVGTDSYRLQYPWQDGVEVLLVSANLLGHYDISLTLRPANGQPPRQRTLAQQVGDARAAMIIGEAFITQERRGVERITSKTAGWRQRPASEKQIGLLRRLGAPVKPNITMGEASNLIDIANARRAR